MDTGSLIELKALMFTSYIGEFVKPVIYVCALSAGAVAITPLAKKFYDKYMPSSLKLSSLENIFNDFK